MVDTTCKRSNIVLGWHDELCVLVSRGVARILEKEQAYAQSVQKLLDQKPYPLIVLCAPFYVL